MAFQDNQVVIKASKFFVNNIVRRNSIFVGTIFASAFFFEIAFDGATKSLWENANKGKLWKDLKATLE